MRKLKFKPCYRKIRVSFSQSSDEVLVEEVIPHKHEINEETPDARKNYQWTEDQTQTVMTVFITFWQNFYLTPFHFPPSFFQYLVKNGRVNEVVHFQGIIPFKLTSM